MVKVLVIFFAFNFISIGFSKAQDNTEFLKTIYDTCLNRHMNYWMSRKDKSFWTDSTFIVRKNENYKGSLEEHICGETIKYYSESEIYQLASKSSVSIISFSPPVISDSVISISVIDFEVTKKKRRYYNFCNYGGSRHVIH